MSSPRILVVGAGGLGGIVTAHLLETGHDVVCMTTNEGIAAAVEARGYRLKDDPEERVVRGPIARTLPEGPFDYVVLAVQPPQVDEAARQVLPVLGPRSQVVCLQNGLCEPRVEAIVGKERVLGAVVGWGGAMPEPGLYDRTAPGGFTIGRYDGTALPPEAAWLSRALEAVGPVETTRNLKGKRFSKLAINCAISSLGTLGGDRIGGLMQHRFVRRLALELMTETVEVARKEGVTLEKVSGTIDLDWIALTEAEKDAVGSPGLLAKHGLLLAVGVRFRRMRSSMLQAIERGRTPAVDFLNGEVVALGERHGVPTRVSAVVRDTVWKIARGEEKSGIPLLEKVFEETGPHGR